MPTIILNRASILRALTVPDGVAAKVFTVQEALEMGHAIADLCTILEPAPQRNAIPHDGTLCYAGFGHSRHYSTVHRSAFLVVPKV